MESLDGPAAYDFDDLVTYGCCMRWDMVILFGWYGFSQLVPPDFFSVLVFRFEHVHIHHPPSF